MSENSQLSVFEWREIRGHEPGNGYPDGYEYFGRKECWSCGSEMKKYKDSGQGGIYSCLNSTRKKREMGQGGCMMNFNVYITHCCGCGAVIDSRYCKWDYESGMYFCAVCGTLCNEVGKVTEWYTEDKIT
jgi:hypothetical protein